MLVLQHRQLGSRLQVAHTQPKLTSAVIQIITCAAIPFGVPCQGAEKPVLGSHYIPDSQGFGCAIAHVFGSPGPAKQEAWQRNTSITV